MTGLSEIIKFVSQEEMTLEEKRLMYSKLSKKELIEMLIESNNLNESLAESYRTITLSQIDCSTPFPTKVYSSDELDKINRFNISGDEFTRI